MNGVFDHGLPDPGDEETFIAQSQLVYINIWLRAYRDQDYFFEYAFRGMLVYVLGEEKTLALLDEWGRMYMKEYRHHEKAVEARLRRWN